MESIEAADEFTEADALEDTDPDEALALWPPTAADTAVRAEQRRHRLAAFLGKDYWQIGHRNSEAPVGSSPVRYLDHAATRNREQQRRAGCGP